MINFYSYKNKSYIASSTLIILTVIIIFFKGLNLGIDFKGGLNFEVRTNLSNEQIFNAFQEIKGDKEIIVKKEIGSDVHTIRIETGNDNASFIEKVNQLIQQHPEMEILISEYIEPTFSDELIKNSLYAMASSLLVIAFYIWIRFDWQFAISGIFALLHDVFIAIGFMSLFNIEFNLTMIAALLLIAGYSINDTIVLFDRLRTITSDENNKNSFSDSAKKETQKIKDQAKKDSENLIIEMNEKFHKLAEIKKNLAQTKISQMKNNAIKDIKNTSAKIAIDAVKKILSTSVDKSKLENLFDKDLKEAKVLFKKINS